MLKRVEDLIKELMTLPPRTAVQYQVIALCKSAKGGPHEKGVPAINNKIFEFMLDDATDAELSAYIDEVTRYDPQAQKQA